MDITFIGYVIYGCVLFLLILFAVCVVFFTHAVYTDHKQNKKTSTVTPDSQNIELAELQNKIQELNYSINGIHTRLHLDSENHIQVINTLLHYNNELQTITLRELNRTTTKTTARRRYHKLR